MAIDVDGGMPSTAAAPPAPVSSRAPRSSRRRFGWVAEAVAILAGYELFEWWRDHVMGSTPAALRHAERLVDIERATGLFHERAIQAHFLGWPHFMAFWNLYYGTIHFVMPVVALVVLYRKAPARYLRWRNALVVMLLVSLAAFVWLPLMPPRLMPPRYGFVDAAARYFNFGPQVKIAVGPDGTPSANGIKAFGNLYAAMPSLHVGWATWASLALLPLARRWWVKALLLVYPLVTLFAVVVTGNHWILDGVGGWVVLAIGWCVVAAVERLRHTNGSDPAQ